MRIQLLVALIAILTLYIFIIMLVQVSIAETYTFEHMYFDYYDRQLNQPVKQPYIPQPQQLDVNVNVNIHIQEPEPLSYEEEKQVEEEIKRIADFSYWDSLIDYIDEFYKTHPNDTPLPYWVADDINELEKKYADYADKEYYNSMYLGYQGTGIYTFEEVQSRVKPYNEEVQSRVKPYNEEVQIRVKPYNEEVQSRVKPYKFNKPEKKEFIIKENGKTYKVIQNTFTDQNGRKQTFSHRKLIEESK